MKINRYFIDNEIWTRVIGFHAYQVSTYGRVRSFKRLNSKYRILSTKNESNGYIRTCLFKEGKRSYFMVHRLVAMSFNLPNPENKPIVKHLDNNPSNNRIDNLEWGTQSENIQQAFDEGRKFQIKGELHPQSKLSDKDVNEIREVALTGGRFYGRKALALKYSVSESMIMNIVTNRKRCL